MKNIIKLLAVGAFLTFCSCSSSTQSNVDSSSLNSGCAACATGSCGATCGSTQIK